MQLSFRYNFEHVNDEVFCAYTVPYTYSQLTLHIKQLKTLQRSFCKFLALVFVKLFRVKSDQVFKPGDESGWYRHTPAQGDGA